MVDKEMATVRVAMLATLSVALTSLFFLLIGGQVLIWSISTSGLSIALPLYTRILLGTTRFLVILGVVLTVWSVLVAFKKYSPTHIRMNLLCTSAASILFQVWGFLALVLPAVFLVLHDDQTAEHTRRAAAGQPILSAIYRCKRDTGAYPTNLSALAPKYLKAPPVVDWMMGWDYGPADYRGLSNGFQLSRFSVGYKTRIEYIDDGTVAGWRVNADGTNTPLNLPDPRKASNQPSEATSQ